MQPPGAANRQDMSHVTSSTPLRSGQNTQDIPNTPFTIMGERNKNTDEERQDIRRKTRRREREQKGSRTTCQLLLFCEELACFQHACMAFLWVLKVLPQSKDMQIGLIGDS